MARTRFRTPRLRTVVFPPALRFLVSGALLIALPGVDGCDRTSSPDATGPEGSSDEAANPASGAIEPDPAGPRNDLESMETVDFTIAGHRFHVWLAADDQERQIGLMNVEAHELARREDGAYRGMLFVFDFEQPLSFWMKNTIIPLDIAYIRTDGTIVKTYTMAPLETRTYPSIERARYALEVQAGLLDELGIQAGHTAEIPDGLLKHSPR